MTAELHAVGGGERSARSVRSAGLPAQERNGRIGGAGVACLALLMTGIAVLGWQAGSCTGIA